MDSDKDETAKFSPKNDYDANDNPDIEVTEEDLEALKDEIEVLHGGDLKEAAGNLLQERAVAAIISISKLATEASAERVRLDASKYIVDRVLGPLSKMELAKDLDDDPIYQFMVKAGLVTK